MHVREKALQILLKHRKAFATSDQRVGEIVGHDVSFKLNTGKPIFQKQFPLNQRATNEAIRQAHQLLEDGIVHRTTSPMNFPLVMVSKGPNKAPRMCVDLRRFNAAYVGEWWPIPDIRTILANAAQDRIFSTIDAVQSFHMLKLRSGDGPIP